MKINYFTIKLKFWPSQEVNNIITRLRNGKSEKSGIKIKNFTIYGIRFPLSLIKE